MVHSILQCPAMTNLTLSLTMTNPHRYFVEERKDETVLVKGARKGRKSVRGRKIEVQNQRHIITRGRTELLNSRDRTVGLSVPVPRCKPNR
jgi:hypothetical protein